MMNKIKDNIKYMSTQVGGWWNRKVEILIEAFLNREITTREFKKGMGLLKCTHKTKNK